MGPLEGCIRSGVRTEHAHVKPLRSGPWHTWVGSRCGTLGTAEHSWPHSWILSMGKCWRLTPTKCPVQKRLHFMSVAIKLHVSKCCAFLVYSGLVNYGFCDKLGRCGTPALN